MKQVFMYIDVKLQVHGKSLFFFRVFVKISKIFGKGYYTEIIHTKYGICYSFVML